MLKWFARRLARTPAKGKAAPLPDVPAVTVSKEARKVSHVADVLYPPQDPGLSVKSPEDLYRSNAELMAMLALHAAVSPDLYRTRFEAPQIRLASFLNVLPGSASASFSGAGGLFRASVETAFNAFRASDGRIFTGAMGVEDRHKLEGRWRYVCFCAGLLYPIGGAVGAMSVVDPAGRKWSPELEGLSTWASTKAVDRVYVSWLSDGSTLGPAPITGTFALSIIGRENVEWLTDGSPDLVKAIVSVVTGAPDGRALLAASLVREMWEAVKSRELARHHQNYGRLTVGAHVSPYLIDALVGLAASSWVINKKTLYVDASGVYLEWPQAGEEVIDYCRTQGYPGIPSNPAALLSILTSTQVVVAGVEGLALVEIADADGEITAAVKLSKPGLLLPDDKTLESFAGARPVTMEALRERDPLKSATGQRARPPESTQPAAPGSGPGAQRAGAQPQLEQVDVESVLQDTAEPAADDDEQEGEAEERPLAVAARADAALTHDTGPLPSEKPRPVEGPRPVAGEHATQRPNRKQPEKGAIVEGQEVKYATFLPADVVAKFRPFEAELLGRLVHIWRTKANDGKLMRMCENGAAFEIALVAQYTRDPVAFLNALGQQGFLYAAPTTPSKMAYMVPVTEGSDKAANCFILAHHAAKRLGLP